MEKGKMMRLQKGVEGEEQTLETDIKQTKKNKAEQERTDAQDAPQTKKKPEIAAKKEQAIISLPAEKKSENGANMKPQKKQVFSFRAKLEDIAAWKAYATATGKKMEDVGTAAMNEYLENHRLTGAERTIFDAMTAQHENR